MNSFKLLSSTKNCIILNKAFYHSPKLFHFILNHCTTLTEIKNIIPQLKAQFKLRKTDHLSDLNTICTQQEETFLKNNNINILTLNNDHYSDLLSEITFPPPVLFYKGNINCLNLPSIAIVGPRKPSSYAKQVTEHFTSKLTQHFCIISGFASGIDTIAHQTCVNQNKPTIAVMGVGLDTFYPNHNTKLGHDILAKNGLLLSEIPLFKRPEKYHFPLRNQTISGLARGVLVTEANEKSGSLITAYAAIDQNRDVFAVPGNILTKTACGTNNLIKQGAKCTTTLTDILEEFALTELAPSTNKQQLNTQNLSQNEQTILNICSHPQDIETIIKKTNLQTQEVLHCLTLLEINNYIKKTGSSTYVHQQ